jgi:hypothetical protein
MGAKIKMSSALRQSSAFQNRHSQTGANGSNSVSVSVTVGEFSRFRTRPFEPRSNWADEIVSKLNELTALPVGWDGYAGRPVSFDSAYFTVNMLERLNTDGVPVPSIVPGSDGSLQVEWHRKMFDVELDVLGPQNVVATRINRSTGDVNEIEIQSDFSEILPWIAALSD